MFFIKESADGVSYNTYVIATTSPSSTSSPEMQSFLDSNYTWTMKIAPNASPRVHYNSRTADAQTLYSTFEPSQDVEFAILQTPAVRQEVLENSVTRSQVDILRRYPPEGMSEAANAEESIIAEYDIAEVYYRRNIVIDTSKHKVVSLQPYVIKHSTDNFITNYGKIICDKFEPSDGQGFLELDITGGFNRNITWDMVQQGNFIRYGQSPSRKMKDVYNSDITIDETNEFTFIPEQYREHLIQQMAHRKIRALEVNNFYRGTSAAYGSIVETRSNKIVKGNYIFPVIIKTKFLDQETLEHVEKKVLVLAIFRDYERVVRYKKSRNFITELLESFHHSDGLKYFDPEAYQEELNALYGKHVKFWSGITRLWNGDWKHPDTVPSHHPHESAIESKDIGHFFGKANIERSSEVKDYRELEKSIEEIKDKREKASNSIRDSAYSLRREERLLQDYKDYIEACLVKIANYKSVIETSEKNFASMELAYNALVPSYDEMKEAFLTKFNDIQPDTEGAETWLSNLKKTGIIVEDITFNHYDEGTVSISEHPLALCDDNYELLEVVYSTTAPVIINIDKGKRGLDCKKVVGGPYRVRVGKSYLKISLTTSNACFGIRKEGEYNTVYVHPHTSGIGVGDGTSSWKNFLGAFVNRSVNGCLGEAAPILYKAFNDKDIKLAIFGSMTWVTSAHSTDAWGKQCKYFPALSEVNLNQDDKLAESSQSEESQEDQLLDQDAIEDCIEDVALFAEALAEESIDDSPPLEEQEVSNNNPVAIAESQTMATRYVYDSETTTFAENTNPPHIPVSEGEQLLPDLNTNLGSIRRDLVEVLTIPTQNDETELEEQVNLRRAGTTGYRPYGT